MDRVEAPGRTGRGLTAKGCGLAERKRVKTEAPAARFRPW